MSQSCVNMGFGPLPGLAHAYFDPTPIPAFADGPVADTAEPVAAQAGVVGSAPDGDDGDAVPHG